MGDQIEELIRSLRSPDSSERLASARALFELKSRAREAVPALLEAYSHEKEMDVRSQISGALMEIPLNPVQEMRAFSICRSALKDEDSEVRADAVWLMTSLTSSGSKVIPFLIEAVYDEDSGVSSAAEDAIRCIGDEAYTEIITTAIHDDNEMRIKALKLIPDFMENISDGLYEEVYNLLLDCLNDKDSRVRFNAILALDGFYHYLFSVHHTSQIVPDMEFEDYLKKESDAYAGYINPFIRTLCQDKDANVRLAAIMGLEGIESMCHTTLPSIIDTLQAALKDVNEEVRLESVIALEKIGYDHNKFIPSIIDFLDKSLLLIKEDDKKVKKAIQEAKLKLKREMSF